MAARWIEILTGSLEEKKRYKEYKARLKALPEGHRTAAEALERYAMYAGAIEKSDVLLQMTADLTDLFERAAADGTPVRDVVGDDPIEFADAFLANYTDGQWINREKARLTKAIEQAADEEQKDGTGS